jgi:hypothetical protein
MLRIEALRALFFLRKKGGGPDPCRSVCAGDRGPQGGYEQQVAMPTVSGNCPWYPL